MVTGAVPDVRPFLAEAAVVVAPLRMGGGTRVKILEAMAMGRPIVSTSVGCEGLDVRDSQHLLIADTSHDMADKIVGLLCDQTRGEALGWEGRRLVETAYDWNAIGANLEQAVHGLLQTSKVSMTRAAASRSSTT
jgi:polysaccharide biosynthesis protein PslH